MQRALRVDIAARRDDAKEAKERERRAEAAVRERMRRDAEAETMMRRLEDKKVMRERLLDPYIRGAVGKGGWGQGERAERARQRGIRTESVVKGVMEMGQHGGGGGWLREGGERERRRRMQVMSLNHILKIK